MTISICQLLCALLGLLNRVGGYRLLVSQHNAILQVQDGNSTTVVNSDLPIVAFDLHQTWHQLFWASDYYIYRTPMYDLKTTTVVAVTGRVGGLVVDWIHHQLYWSDVTRGRIEAVHLDGTGRRVVHHTACDIGAMALDPQAGKLFWIESTRQRFVSIASDPTELYLPDFCGITQIRSSNFDGSHPRIIHMDTNIHSSGPLAIDVIYKSIYFYKVTGDISEQWEINYDGIEPQIKLFERKEAPAKSLSLARNGFFYSNSDGLWAGTWVRKRYTLVYGNNTDDFVLLDPTFQLADDYFKNASQIRTVLEASQPRWQDHCSHQCQHDCIGPPASTSGCVCRFGYKLNEDNSSCSEEGYILFSTSSMFGRMRLDGLEATTLFNETSEVIQTFDIHLHSGHVYWSDLLTQNIYKAPVDLPSRKQKVIEDAGAYGVAVDWVHHHLYWTDDSRVMVSSLTGDLQMLLLSHVEAPSDISVDPINRFIFWAECGASLSLKRAGLDGSDIKVIATKVLCGASLSPDPYHGTVYWLDWTGTLHFCQYDGSGLQTLYSDLPRASEVLMHRLMWFPLDEDVKESIPTSESFLNQHRGLFTPYEMKFNAMKVIKSSQQPPGQNTCLDIECSGLCFPKHNSPEPACLCPDDGKHAAPCSRKDVAENNSKSYLRVLSSTPFSVTLQCGGSLLTHPVLQPFLEISEVASLVARPPDYRPSWFIRVANKSTPFTIDTLNPATSYSVALRNRVTRSSYSLTVHTPPPPIPLVRLPLITLPGVALPLTWHQQDVHYSSPNAWEDLVHSEYILVLVSKKKYYQSDSFQVQKPVLDLIQDEIKDNFIVLKQYKNKEEFDDDPEMHLGNIPWGDEFWLAMVQVTEYQRTYHLDIVYSETFSLPDPYWTILLEDILSKQPLVGL